ncbi:hypothetical protein CDD81_3010 [Ophiocordyceps australis]|uniref:Small ribosomal subunit protein mS29 n=1 Tax=Ophiocordyceps australis TaxID=1399860 RepID=A0A2C5YJY8_9HYPO|nr:hypothetical protein CDD81_3010 [Ophiocordyceps australis]
MASAAPLRCLASPTTRPLVPNLTRLHIQRAGICSSSRLLATETSQTVRSRRDLLRLRPNNSYKKKPKPTAGLVKKPAPGERKAYRKRIQLSNESALPVAGLSLVEQDTLADSKNSAQVVALPAPVVQRLHALEAFKAGQSWGLFKRPHFLVRSETVQLVSRMNAAAEAKETLRCVLTGSRWTGKSTMMVQAMAHALVNEWVVIHIHEGQDLSNGLTDYQLLKGSKPLQFSQPTYCLNLLKKIYAANRDVLERLPLQLDASHKAALKASTTIADLISNTKEVEYAWPVFQAMWSELLLPGRPRLLFTLDGLSHINRVSKYRDPSFKPIHSHDLALVATFCNALSGRTPLPNGGAVMAATSGNNTFSIPSQELAIAQREAAQTDKEIPQPNPYERHYDNRVYQALQQAWVLRVESISRPEARSLMEYWGASGLIRAKLDSLAITEKWTLGGHGIVGEMERATLVTMNL